ncbi:exported hypothetical protein [Pseudoclavibacter sp. 8L]|nr:exported hypothetical protein [Pseudoclavibacter sp. 8L]
MRCRSPASPASRSRFRGSKRCPSRAARPWRGCLRDRASAGSSREPVGSSWEAAGVRMRGARESRRGWPASPERRGPQHQPAGWPVSVLFGLEGGGVRVVADGDSIVGVGNRPVFAEAVRLLFAVGVVGNLLVAHRWPSGRDLP